MKRNIASGIRDLGFQAKDQIKIEKALAVANVKQQRDSFLKKYFEEKERNIDQLKV